MPATEFGDLTMLKLPDDDVVSLELVHKPDAGRIDPRGLSHLVIQVEDLFHTVTRLRAAASRWISPARPMAPTTSGRRHSPDPDGYRIELVQWPVGHADGMTDADFHGEAPPPGEAHDQTP